MKNALAYSLDSEKYDGDPLVVRRLEGDSKTKLGELQREREKFVRLALPSKWVQLLIACALLAGVLLVLVGVEFLTGETVTPQTNTAAIVLFCVGGPFAVIGAAGIIWISFRARKIFGSSDYRFFEEREEKVLSQFREELGVPDTAAAADAFAYCYRVKNGKIRYQSPASKNCCLNESVRLYADADALFVATEQSVLRIPFASSFRIERIEKRKAFYGWNKQEKPNKGAYKQYKIRSNDSGAFTVKPYFALKFYADGEDYELLFPPYEYDTLSRLTGRTA